MAEMYKWKGFAELEQNLLALGREMHEKGVKRMMSRAAVPMRDDAKNRAPILKSFEPRRIAGLIKNSIKIWRHRKTPYAATYYVGIRALSRAAIRKFKSSGAPSRDNPKDPFYWRFLEFGTSKMAARPFLRPAFEANKTKSVQVALQEGQDFVRKTAAKFKRVK